MAIVLLENVTSITYRLLCLKVVQFLDMEETGAEEYFEVSAMKQVFNVDGSVRSNKVKKRIPVLQGAYRMTNMTATRVSEFGNRVRVIGYTGNIPVFQEYIEL